jgi:hypothetical protein
VANRLSADHRDWLNQVIEQAKERGLDRAALIKEIKKPLETSKPRRGPGRPPKHDPRDLATRVLRRIANGESFWAASNSIAGEISESAATHKSRAHGIRETLKRYAQARGGSGNGSWLTVLQGSDEPDEPRSKWLVPPIRSYAEGERRDFVLALMIRWAMGKPRYVPNLPELTRLLEQIGVDMEEYETGCKIDGIS